MPVKFRWQALPSAAICHVYCAEEDDGVSGWASCPGGAEAFTIQFENGETCPYASMLGSAIQSPTVA
jgi:hypothetical protein